MFGVPGSSAERTGISLLESVNCKDFNSNHWIFVEMHICFFYLILATD